MNQAFCILSAGRGSRLGQLTADINKALLPVDNKAAISHIIEKAPADCEIVVAVGYDGEKVKEYCLAAHPERSFIFVEVDKLEGPGSGPGYSLLCCKPYLQRPFYLCNVDTLVGQDSYPPLAANWIGVAATDTPEKYATVCREEWLGNYYIKRFIDKHPRGTEHAYIGLLGLKDYWIFWEHLEQALSDHSEQQYIAAFTNECLWKLYPIEKRFDWFDTGSVDGYEETCRAFQGVQVLGLPKNINEITYKVNGRLIKLCLDSEKNSRRLARAELLHSHIPPLVYKGLFVMAYEWVDGNTLYSGGCDLDTCDAFLDFCERDLWVPSTTKVDRWDEICRSFYCDKSWDRLDQYYQSRGMENGRHVYVNGHYCYAPESYLTYLDWDRLCDGTPVQFHGDLQFDNVIEDEEGRWYLIDWRESFGDSLLYGDIYYDLAKLYSGLDLPYDCLKRNEFSFHRDNAYINYSYKVDSKLSQFREMFEIWIVEKGYDLKKVKTLAALVHLNMAPLHPGDLGDLLYYHGVFRLSVLKDWSPK